jgi:hypothetical protein
MHPRLAQAKAFTIVCKAPGCCTSTPLGASDTTCSVYYSPWVRQCETVYVFVGTAETTQIMMMDGLVRQRSPEYTTTSAYSAGMVLIKPRDVRIIDAITKLTHESYA